MTKQREALAKHSPNFARWSNYCDPFPTNDRYIVFGWLWMIGAALQRRVWLDGAQKQTFPNNYFLFIAPPGVGKSNITDQIRSVFELQSEEKQGSIAHSMRDGKLLFPVSADSSSFEAFVQFTAQSMRPMTLAIKQPDGSVKTERYYYCSPAFILDEVKSIFTQKAQDMATFLLTGWNCQRIYERNTIGRGADVIHNLCVNLIAGTQPGVLGELSRTSVVDNGFSRRALMIYAGETNKHVIDVDHTAAQLVAFTEVVTYVRKLAKLYGNMKFSPEAREWLEDKYVHNRVPPLNTSQYLEYYHNTELQHVKKLAMAIHFSDRTDLVLDVGSVQLAYDLLKWIEPEMHYAFVSSGDARGALVKAIKATLRTAVTELTPEELYCDVVETASYEEMLIAVNDLVQARVLSRSASGHLRLVKK